MGHSDHNLSELSNIRDALNIGPDDQSLWYYHHFLISTLLDDTRQGTIVLGLTIPERQTYIRREIDDIKDLLLDYDEIKLIYEALVDYTTALTQLGNRDFDRDESLEMAQWLNKLRELDPKRNGRWDDLLISLNLGH